MAFTHLFDLKKPFLFKKLNKDISQIVESYDGQQLLVNEFGYNTNTLYELFGQGTVYTVVHAAKVIEVNSFKQKFDASILLTGFDEKSELYNNLRQDFTNLLNKYNKIS